MRRTKRQMRSKGQAPRLLKNSSASSIRFTGSVRAREDGFAPVTTRLSYEVQVWSTAAANLAVFNSAFDTSSVSSTARWASMKAIYGEWRPVALSVHYFPYTMGGIAPMSAAGAGAGQAQLTSPFFLLPYKGSATVIANLANAADHQVRVVSSSHGKGLSASVRMDEADEASWVSTNTTTPGAVMGIKTYAQQGTIGATDVFVWGSILVDILCQFRSPVATSLQLAPSAAKEESSSDSAVVQVRPQLSGRAVTLLRTVLDECKDDYISVLPMNQKKA